MFWEEKNNKKMKKAKNINLLKGLGDTVKSISITAKGWKKKGF